MKKAVFLSVLAAMLPLTIIAQDDVYFTSSDTDDEDTDTSVSTSSSTSTYRSARSSRRSARPWYTYYSGSDRDVDEYNRRPSLSASDDDEPIVLGPGTVEALDSAESDVIAFEPVIGEYPDEPLYELNDSLAGEYGYDDVYYDEEAYYDDGYYDDDDYECTRELCRWYDCDPYWAGYYAGRASRWWYDPWYYSWYDPWYYWWYDPWYWGWYGWHGWWGYSGWLCWGWGGHHHGGWWGGRRGTSHHSRSIAGRNGSFRGGVSSDAVATSKSMASAISGRDRQNNKSFASYTRGYSSRYANSSRGGYGSSNRSRSYSGSRSSSYSGSRGGFSSGRSSFGGSRGGSFGGSRGGSFGGSRGGGSRGR